MRCTEVAGRPFPGGHFSCRDIGDRGRSRLKDYRRVMTIGCPTCDEDQKLIWFELA